MNPHFMSSRGIGHQMAVGDIEAGGASAYFRTDPTTPTHRSKMLSESSLSTIGFDADDTLWQNEHFYRLTEQRFGELLAGYAEARHLSAALLEAEKRNLQIYGFGIKGFTLSMIETAIELTEGRVPSSIIGEILAVGREMLNHPVETLPYARTTLEQLAESYRLILITKGDLFDQERKLALSGLGELFDAVEIVSDKNIFTYERIFSRHGDGPFRSMMVGNSLKSDVLPAIQAGSWGVYVPHDLTWVVEHSEEPANEPRFRRLDHLGELVNLVAELR
jgi:putative hydrolase of the HAD superfamily